MGLGFASIAASGATPFWQTLADNDGTLDSPLMAFQLTRFIDAATSTSNVLQLGGTFNLGAVNNSLFTGDIDYQDIPSGQEGYWIQELAGTHLHIFGSAYELIAVLYSAYHQRQLRYARLRLWSLCRH